MAAVRREDHGQDRESVSNALAGDKWYDQLAGFRARRYPGLEEVWLALGFPLTERKRTPQRDCTACGQLEWGVRVLEPSGSLCP